MKVLGIETSCDETAIAVLEAHLEVEPPSGLGRARVKILSNVISSQVQLHAKFGGVVPLLAAREHANNIRHVFERALREAGILNFKKDIDLIAVTHGPGLGPALLVGIAFAKTIAMLHDKILVGVNHMEGHIFSNWLPPIAEAISYKLKAKSFPVLNLIVSGGHTELVIIDKNLGYRVVGETMDDAVGEAFDKVARLLNLGYPGGPAISQRAEKWKYRNIDIPKLDIILPRPMEKSKDYNFSYSGLKTAVLYKIRGLKEAGVEMNEEVVNEICHAFQEAAINVLIQKTVRAAKEFSVKAIWLSGGVSANSLLRDRLANAAAELKIPYSQPLLEYTGDNAAMIALAGHISWNKASKKTADWRSIQMQANLRF